MERQHTPGPWVVSDHILARDGKRVATYSMLSRDDDENEANARLIAAAPDLLAALIEAKQWHQGDKWRNDEDEANATAWQLQMNRIDAAIAKATS